MGSTPLRATAAEAALRGQPLDAERIAAAAEQAAEGTEPPGRPQRDAGLQAPPRARAVPARAARRPGRGGVAGPPRAGRPGRAYHAVTFEAIDDVSGRWPARATSPTGASPRRCSSPPRSSSRCCSRARRASGKTEVARALAQATGRAADPAAVPRGHRPPPRRLRLGLPAPAARDPRGRGGRGRARAVRARVPAAPAAARGARGRRRRRAADRRGRPRRRRVRGVPARVPGRLRGHDPGARHGHARGGARSSC